MIDENRYFPKLDPARQLPKVVWMRTAAHEMQEKEERNRLAKKSKGPAKSCYNPRIRSVIIFDMDNFTSVTLVAADNTIWTAPASAFTQVTAPAEPFVPTEAQVQAAVDAGVIAAYTPATAA